MKANRIIIALVMLMAGMSSCQDWFDVSPKADVKAEDMFEAESGFRDILTGVYGLMIHENLYGRQLTFGYTDVLAQYYNQITTQEHEYIKTVDFKYNEPVDKAVIEKIWSTQYKAIANLNTLLAYIDKKQEVFSSDAIYRIYKGEALGLRAFLHFELLRIFAPAYTSNPNAGGIPYVTRYMTGVTPQSTVAEVTDLLIRDLTMALTLLEADPLYSIEANEAYSTRNVRSYRFNYYAVAATLARVYQWRGTAADMAEALKYATKVIEDAKFSWVHYSSMQSQNPSEWDRLFSSELIFRLAITDMDEEVEPYFYDNTDKTKRLSPSVVQWEGIYEFEKGYGADWRYEKNWQYSGSDPIFAKYWQYENGSYGGFVPVIRWSEMHYIAAEASVATDPQKAVHYVDTVRYNRYLRDFPLDKNLSEERIKEEIYKEYRKEMIGEGQLFYYYKRLKYMNIPGSAISGNDDVYVLPMPDNEIEFGNRN